MRHNIIWSQDAAEDLVEIILLIKYKTEDVTAEHIYKQFISELRRVSIYVGARKTSPLLKDIGINDICHFDVNPWIVYYRIREDTIEIMSIIDERRNPEEALYEKIIIDGKIR
jgi:toxin ParE1/3/4